MTSLHIVHTEASLGWGGQEIRILTEAAGLMARGHQLTLLAPAESRIFHAAGKLGIPALALPIGRKNPEGFMALYHALKKLQPDVVNTHSSTDSWLMALASRLPGVAIPTVRTRHISAPVKQSAPTRWLYRSACQRVVTTGESLRRDLINRLDLAPSHVVSVATGIDLQDFNPDNTIGRAAVRHALNIGQSTPLVGIIATLRSWKGHEHLFEALKQLLTRKPETRLLVVGDGPMRPSLEARAAALELGSSVIFLGQREDVPALLGCLDVFALPSYANEGVPQAIMQAMAMGLPVVSTTVGAIDEAVVDGKTGILLPPKRPDLLAATLGELLEDTQARENYGMAARKFAVEKFSLATMLDHMEAIFSQARSRQQPGMRA